MLSELRARLDAIQQEQGSTASRIEALQQALAHAQQALAALQQSEAEALRRQEEFASFVKRLDAILTGSASRGAAGEHLLEVVLEHLPPDFKAFNLKIRNKVVEFAFRLPNGKHVPVDSKWVGAAQLERLSELASENGERTREDLERMLLDRCKELSAYCDPDLTLGFAVVAVPDAVYRWTQRVHPRALELGVIVIAYSMAVPYFLTLLQVAVRFLRDDESARLSQSIHQLESALRKIQEELQGRYARALTMLQNSRDELATQAAGALAAVQQIRTINAPAAQPALAPGDEDGMA